MSETERDIFVGNVRIAVLAIQRKQKGPLCAPVWYRYSSASGFQIPMANESAKALLLRRHGFATLCIQDEKLPYRYVTAEGPVELTTLNKAERYEAIKDIASRYLGTEAGKSYADTFPDHDEALVTLTPRNWNSNILGD
ncbi:MAG: pyridoxamine 5'-phosphate oxidase family protein [Actinomycetota bacterium]|nr:pyridoxamine 5'-phosphate oxidase family protein [Acidimicrobiales bacterium]